VVFIAEAYDNDPAKVPGSDPVVSQLNGGKSNVMFDLLNAGFTAVYDDPTYKRSRRSTTARVGRTTSMARAPTSSSSTTRCGTLRTTTKCGFARRRNGAASA
jgi:hypothetical protein